MKLRTLLLAVLTMAATSASAQTKVTQLVLGNSNGLYKINAPSTPGTGTRIFEFPSSPTGSKIVMSESTNGQTIGGAVTFTGAVDFGSSATLAIGGSSGSTGDVLTRTSTGGFTWQAPSGGGGGGTPITLTLTSPLTIGGSASADLSTDRTIALDLSVANTWTGAQTFPQSITQGNLLVSSINAGDQPIGVAHGGTGVTSFTANRLLLGNGTSSIGELSTGTNGSVLTLVGGVPSWESDSVKVVGSDATSTASGLTEISGLSFVAGANEVWEIEATLKLGSTGTNGITLGIDVPSGSVVGLLNAPNSATSGTVARIIGDNSASVAVCITNDQNHFVTLKAYASVGATGGPVYLKWGRGAASGTSTIYAKSRLTARKL
jgi:hypothetical protein